MRRIFRGWMWKAGLVALVAFTAYYLSIDAQLQKYDSFINKKYAKQIAMLEASAVSQISESDSLGEYTERLRNRLEDTFAADVFYSVDGSWDGHRGARGFKLMLENATVYTYSGARVGPRHRIDFAGTSFGTRLLRYQITLPDAPLFKHMSILFLRDTIDEELKAANSH